MQFRREDGSSVLQEHEVKALIQAAVPLAARAAKDGREREYRAVMSVLLECAKLEQHDKPIEHQHAHIHAEVGVSSIIGMMQAEVERRGILDGPNGNGNGS